MGCTNHPDFADVRPCGKCGRPFCFHCVLPLFGGWVCATCKEAEVARIAGSPKWSLPSEALTMALIGIFVLGPILQPIALSRGIRALRQIRSDPSLPGQTTAVAAVAISVLVLLFYGTIVGIVVFGAFAR